MLRDREETNRLPLEIDIPAEGTDELIADVCDADMDLVYTRSKITVGDAIAWYELYLWENEK